MLQSGDPFARDPQGAIACDQIVKGLAHLLAQGFGQRRMRDQHAIDLRQIAMAGFWMEARGALTLLAVVPALPDLAYSSAAYAAVFLWHFWTYAVLQDGPYDDFRVLRP